MSNPQIGDTNAVNAAKAAALVISQDKDRQALADNQEKDREAKVEAASVLEARAITARNARYSFWGPIIISVLGVVTTTIGATAGVIAAWRTGTIQVQQVQQDQDLKGYVKHVNSMKDELVEEVRKSAFIAGEAAEKSKEKGK